MLCMPYRATVFEMFGSAPVRSCIPVGYCQNYAGATRCGNMPASWRPRHFIEYAAEL